MQSTKINLRVKNILRRIFSKNDYITISDISKDLGISTRTILRELPAAEEWLEKKGCRLEKKSGVGIKICGTAEDRNKVFSLLAEEKEEKIYTPEERQTIICMELLNYKEPVKLFNFSKMLNVSEGTISSDLDRVEAELDKYNLVLIRKQGLGVYVEGDEDNIRKCMINLIYENIDENFLLSLIRKGVPKDPVHVSNIELIARSMLLNLVDTRTIQKLEDLVLNTEGYIGHKLADSAYVGLIVHLAIAVQRISQDEDISIDKQFMDELRKSKEYPAAKKLATEIEDKFGISVPEDEIGYITMHIKGSKNNTINADENQGIDNDEIVRLSKAIISTAEKETGKLLEQNDKLLIGLINHLGPALNRLKMHLDIRNPLHQMIKDNYPDLFKLAQKCSVEIEKFVGIKIPETEVAYLAMHLGAAIESNTVKKRVYRAVIACTTGIGTSRLLATRIEKEYENIDIVDVVSTRHIEQSWLKEKNVEFVISTVEIEESPVPVIVVNPLLLEGDKLKITILLNTLKNIASKKIHNTESIGLKDKMLDLNSYGEAITEVLDNFFLMEDSRAESIDDLIKETSNCINLNNENTVKLEMALKLREEKGATFIKEHGILLLHCRTEAVDRLYFGIIKVMKEIEDQKIDLGIVMIAPEHSTKYKLETISHISAMLIDKPEFIDLLKDYNKEEALNELSNILEDFYKQKTNKYLKSN